MRGWLTGIWTAVAALVLAGPAMSETKTIRMSGPWELFGGSSSKGTGVCGVSTEPEGKYFGLKVFARQTQEMVIHMGGKGFPLAKDQRTNMRMQVDAKPVWEGSGKGFSFDDGDPGVEFVLANNRGPAFFAELMAGSSLKVSLPQAGMPDWVYNLAGTGALANEFNQCLRSLR